MAGAQAGAANENASGKAGFFGLHGAHAVTFLADGHRVFPAEAS